MDKKLKKQWVDALRSGNYAQGKERLCMLDIKGNARYCCLGVLREEVSGECVWQDRGAATTAMRSSIDGSARFLLAPPEGLSGFDIDQLMSMNDTGSTFGELADWIEENIPGE